MTRIPVLIAEDEAPQRHELRTMLESLWPELEVVAECADGLAALEAIEALEPLVLFLDIRMPGVSGLEVARAADERAHVIFTTAYEQHALQAFECGAFDYLLKPVKRDRLQQALQRVRSRLDRPLADAPKRSPEPVRPAVSRHAGIQWITASAGDTVRMFSIDEILFFQARDKYTRVVAADKEGVIRTPLKELLAGLDSLSFWQVHRSVIVRVSAISCARYDDDGRLSLSIKGRDDLLPVSSAFRYRFKAM